VGLGGVQYFVELGHDDLLIEMWFMHRQVNQKNGLAA